VKRLLLVLAFAFAARAQNVINPDRPGIADGSAVVPHGWFQIEIGAERDDDVWSSPTLLRYGVTDSFELRVETNGYDDGSLAPVSIGFKKHFASTPSLGVIGRWFVDDSSGDLRLAADMELSDKWSINPNIGVAYEDDSTSGLAAMTLQYNINDKVNVFVDGALQTPGQVIVDGGVAWILGTRTQLDFSAGWGAHGSDVPDRFWSAGISRAF
jgi:outer membrane putative beta-barrel porin/alpha-amylase